MSSIDPIDLPLSLGRQMVEARKRTGMNQTALAERWGLHRSTIGRYENDDTDGLLFRHLVDLATLSGWPLELFARAIAKDNGDDGPGGQGVPPTIWKTNVLPLRPRLVQAA